MYDGKAIIDEPNSECGIMMEGWNKIRLNEFVKFQRGFDLPKVKFKSGNVPVYGSTSILGYHNVAKVKAPGVITGRSGTLGRFQYAKQDFWPHNTSLWVKDFKGNDTKYAYFLMQCLDFADFNSGGAVPTLNRNVLRSFKVDVPPLPTQRKIAKILSAYDDLIENNLKRIKLLEEMAQKTYEEWFVRFKFPGHETAVFDKETGLPEGWEKVKLEDVLEIKNGKSNKGLNKNGVYEIYGSNGIIGSTNTFNRSNEIIIGRVGAYCGATRICRNKFWATDNTITAKTKSLNVSNYFTYFKFIELNLRNLAGGAAQPLLTQRLIGKLKVVVPSQYISKIFKMKCEKVFSTKDNIIEQNQHLKEARDILLPRLMTGIIDVEKLSESGFTGL